MSGVLTGLCLYIYRIFFFTQNELALLPVPILNGRDHSFEWTIDIAGSKKIDIAGSECYK